MKEFSKWARDFADEFFCSEVPRPTLPDLQCFEAMKNEVLRATQRSTEQAKADHDHARQKYHDSLWGHFWDPVDKKVLARVMALTNEGSEEEKARADLSLYGTSVMLDGKHVPLSGVVLEDGSLRLPEPVSDVEIGVDFCQQPAKAPYITKFNIQRFGIETDNLIFDPVRDVFVIPPNTVVRIASPISAEIIQYG